MSGDEAMLSRDMANELRRRKNAGKGDISTALNGGIDGDDDYEEWEERSSTHSERKVGPTGKKLRHGHGKESTYRTEEEMDREYDPDGRGDNEVKAFGNKNY